MEKHDGKWIDDKRNNLRKMYGQVVISMMESGKIIKEMVLEYKNLLMVKNNNERVKMIYFNTLKCY